MENLDVTLVPYEQVGEKIAEMQNKIDELRLNGVTKISNLKNENSNIKRNKQIDKETKEKILAENVSKIEEAKAVAAENKEEISTLVKQLDTFIKANYDSYIKQMMAVHAKRKEEYLEEFNKEIARENEYFTTHMAQLSPNKNEDVDAKKDLTLKHKQIINDAKVLLNEKLSKDKDELHLLKLEKFNAIDASHNKHMPIGDTIQLKAENYKHQFTWKQFLLNNGLYLAIIALLVVAIIYYASTSGRFLLDMNVILLTLQQAAPKMFLALGVGGLIVLAGTDLSVGRLVGLVCVLTCMLSTTTGTTTLTFFGNNPDFSAMPLGLRVLFGFLLSLVFCVAITSIAGFFSAKFKMHPFISTLATQLMTYGLLAGITNSSYTGGIDPTVQRIFSGNIGSSGFNVMIIYAIIGIAVMWFIWNKTKFGKNMFAVGGNPEAAAVSGINVFWVTMGVFILAGIYYTFGGFLTGMKTGSVRATTGGGYETDAIAACVVGGVSFTGGVGKIRGIVIGCILFELISVVLPYIGITDANFQLAIKGLIVLVAVTLDCAKYLKKK